MRIQSTMMHLSMPGVARTDDVGDPMRRYIPDAIPPPPIPSPLPSPRRCCCYSRRHRHFSRGKKGSGCGSHWRLYRGGCRH